MTLADSTVKPPDGLQGIAGPRPRQQQVLGEMCQAGQVLEVVELTEGQSEGHLHLIRGIILEQPGNG